MEDKKLHSRLFGEVMRDLRTQRGLTQDELAALVGTERSHISALERAEKGPALATIFSVADGLGVSAEELIGLVERKLGRRRR